MNMKFIRFMKKLQAEYNEADLIAQKDHIKNIAEREIISIQKNDLLTLKEKNYFTHQIVMKVIELFSSAKPKIVLMKLNRILEKLAEIYKQKPEREKARAEAKERERSENKASFVIVWPNKGFEE